MDHGVGQGMGHGLAKVLYTLRAPYVIRVNYKMPKFLHSKNYFKHPQSDILF